MRSNENPLYQYKLARMPDGSIINVALVTAVVYPTSDTISINQSGTPVVLYQAFTSDTKMAMAAYNALVDFISGKLGYDFLDIGVVVANRLGWSLNHQPEPDVGGDTITITGTTASFASGGSLAVLLNDIACSAPTFVDNNHITFTAPALGTNNNPAKLTIINGDGKTFVWQGGFVWV